MEQDSKTNDGKDDALDALDLLRAANHVRAVAIRQRSEALHKVADQIVALAGVMGGAKPEAL